MSRRFRSSILLPAAVAVLILAAASAAKAAPAALIDDRMTLVEAIDAVRAAGVEIVYSSELVKAWMRVRATPVEAEPTLALRIALAEYDLDLEPGPDGRWLVVRAAPQPRSRRRQTPDREPAPEPARPRPIEEITVVGSRHALFRQDSASGQFLSGEQIRRMPHMADDTFRALHRLPGTAANDYQAPFNLRGGAANEVKVRLDGLEIVDPFHMRTLFQPLSIIDPGIIDGAQLLSGGYTAEHGNFMSGVIDISSGRSQSDTVNEIGVSFISAFGRSMGEFAGGRGSYLISGRRGYLDLLADAIVDDGEELDPRYSDLFARTSYDVNDSITLSAHVLLANDDVRFVDPGDGEDFGEDSWHRYLWLSAETELWPGITATSILSTGRVSITEDGSQVNPPAENLQRYYAQELRLSSLQSDWIAKLSDRQLLKAGFRYRSLESSFDYRLNSERRSDFVNNDQPVFLQRNIRLSNDGEDFSAYAAYRARAGRSLSFELGARWDRQNYAGERSDSQLSPRINLLYDLGERTEVNVAWGEFYQPQAIHDLDIPDGDTRYYPAQGAEHLAAGLRHLFASGLGLQADVYSKRYTRLRPRYENLLDTYEFAPESNFDRAIVRPTSGRAYGAELTLRSDVSTALDWWLSYSWSKANDEIDGQTVPRSWDQRHALTSSIAWQGERWSVSAVGRYRSGWPRTVLDVVPVVDDNGNIVGGDVDLSARNGSQFDDYTRVDVRVTRRVPLDRGSFEFYVELFNVFDTENQCCTSNHSVSIGSSVNVFPEFDNFLPRFPSFGFIWRFGPGVDD